MLKNLLSNNSLSNKYQKIINQINLLENSIQTLTDSELRNKTITSNRQYTDTLFSFLPVVYIILKNP